MKMLHGYMRMSPGKINRLSNVYNNEYVLIREAVEDALSCRATGSFLVRRPTSMTSTNTYVLSIRVPKYMKRSCVVHYLIDQDNLGYRLRVCIFILELFIRVTFCFKLFPGNKKSFSNIEFIYCTSFNCC